MAVKSTLKSMALTLFLVCLFGSAVMAGIYALTKDKIESANNDKINGAIVSVMPSDVSNNPASDQLTQEFKGKTYIVYPGKNKKDEVIAYAIESASPGYEGDISILVGFKTDGTIHDIAVISHRETPGLGDKIEPSKSTFSVQFKGKDPASFKILVKQDGGEIDAITASTITSRAYCDAVTNAWEVFKLCNK